MDLARQLDAIDEQGEALLAAVATAPHARVPACPDWDASDLAFHIGEVHSFWAWNVSEQPPDPRTFTAPDRPDDVVGWARDRRGALLAALRAVPAATPIWTWSDDHSVAFVARWQVVEAAVHRADADQAAGRATIMAPALAAYGIDAFLEYCRNDPRSEAAPAGGSVHLHCTDAAGEWTISNTNELAREHTKGDVAVRGRALDLLLALFRRQDLSRCEVLGDAAVAARFVARASLD